MFSLNNNIFDCVAVIRFDNSRTVRFYFLTILIFENDTADSTFSVEMNKEKKKKRKADCLYRFRCGCTNTNNLESPLYQAVIYNYKFIYPVISYRKVNRRYWHVLIYIFYNYYYNVLFSVIFFFMSCKVFLLIIIEDLECNNAAS